jgi:hypothetical protein
MIIVILYVDDILAASKDQRKLDELIKQFCEEFDVRVMGEPEMFLGMNVERDRENKMIYLSQKTYIRKLLQRFAVWQGHPSRLPIAVDVYKHAQREGEVTQQPFKELLGGLLYISVCTRPDISFAVSYLSSFFSSPSNEHFEQAVKILLYLKGTIGLMLPLGGEERECTELNIFADADWAQDPIDRRSRGGFIMKVNQSLIGWSSKKLQGLQSLSSTEAEYVQVASASKEILWFQPQLEFLGYVNLDTVLWEDNMAVISLIKKENSGGRTKHLDVRLKFLVTAIVHWKRFRIQYVRSENNLADILTKPMALPKFRDLREKLLSEF